MNLLALIDASLQARSGLFDIDHLTAFRLFNGFLEGFPELALDLYSRTLVIYNFANPSEKAQPDIRTVFNHLLEIFPWLQAVILKERNAWEISARHGKILFGEKPNRWVREQNVRYAIDLLLTLDSTLYLDTRLLRMWAIQHSQGRRVFNAFAYTGSLGVAALAGGASQVVHLDQARKFLNLAKESYSLNGFKIRAGDFLCGDFYSISSRLRHSEAKFNLVFLDPPFFSISPRGRVDLNKQGFRLINKVRPLVETGGYLVAVNNALFVSGLEYMAQLEKLCSDGYLSIETIIPVPPDITGYPETRVGTLPVDPSPFNHATKIVVLKAR